MKNSSVLTYQNYKIDAIEKSIKRRKLRFRITTLVLICILVACYFVIPNIYISLQDKFLHTTDKQELDDFFSNDYLKNDKSIEWYEKNDLGNTNNNYLVGFPNSVDYSVLNSELNEGIVCVNDKREIIYIANGDSIVLSNVPIIEFVVKGDSILYISQEDDKLYKMNCNGEIKGELVPELLLDTPIDRFAVLGNNIVYLDKASKLYLWNSENNTKTIISENVNRFFLGDGFIVQNGTDIFRIDYSTNKTQKIISGGILEGYDSESVYYIDSDLLDDKYELLKYDTNTEKTESVSVSEKMIHGVYFDEDNVYVDTVK